MRILVVEDEQKIAAAIKRGLEMRGFAVDIVHDGESGLNHALDSDYDAVVLDRMLPGMDGIEITEKVRKAGSSVPILMLTARGTIGDKIEGLNSGADDYLVKPFSFEELIARVNALLRRRPVHTGTEIIVGDLRLDTVAYRVFRGDTEIKLSQKEYSLLEYLMRNAEQVMTKDMIISHVWDQDTYILPNTVEVYIGYLRNKIDRPFKSEPEYIRTVRGFGYKVSASK